MYIETMESVLKNAQKIILDDQGGKGVVPYLPLDQLRRISPAAGEEDTKQQQTAPTIRNQVQQ